MQSKQLRKRELFLFFLFFFALTFFLFGGALNNFFTSDDFLLLKMAKDFSFGKILEPIPGGFFRPIIKPVFSVLFNLFELNPLPYRLAVFSLHAINSFLVFLLALFLFSDKKKAFACAIVFCAFFLNAEVLFEVATINELLLAFFSLASVLFFVLSVEKKNKLFFVCSVFFFALAVFSKESAVLFWLVLIALDLLFFSEKQKKSRQIVFRQSFFALVIALYLLFALSVTRTATFSSLFVFLSNFFQATMILFAPLGQIAIIIARPLPQSVLALPIFLVCFFVVLALFFLSFKKYNNIVLFSLFWFFVFIFPPLVLGAIQARYFYLPFIGGSIFFVSVLSIVLQKANSFFGKRLSLSIEKVFFIVLVFFVLFSGFYIWGHENKHAFAGVLVKNFISDANSFALKFSGKEFIFLNKLDRIDTPLDFDAPLVLRNGLREAFDLYDVNIVSFSADVPLSDVNSFLLRDRLVLLFDSEKQHLLKVKNISFSKNLLEKTDWVVSSNLFSGESIYSKSDFLPVSKQSVFLEFSSNVLVEGSPAYAYIFICRRPPEKKCFGLKGEDWTDFEKGSWEFGQAKQINSFLEVSEKYYFFFLRFDIKGAGKAVFDNTKLQQVFFEFE